MTARAIGEISIKLTSSAQDSCRDQTHHDKYRGNKPRTIRKGGNGVAVRRNSYYEGQLEDRIWRPFAGGKPRRARRVIGAMLKAIKMHERQTRFSRQQQKAGCRNGVLGPIAIEVFEALCHKFLDFRTGRLDPSVEAIAQAVGRSYNAVHNALKSLRAAGYLHWIRRSRPKDNPDAWGPQIEQISNAYAILIPANVKALIGWIMGKAPTPIDERHRREQQQDELDTMLSTLASPEYLDAVWEGDSLLGEALKNIARLVEERESSTGAETGMI